MCAVDALMHCCFSASTSWYHSCFGLQLLEAKHGGPNNMSTDGAHWYD